jgi:hypothetical protein
MEAGEAEGLEERKDWSASMASLRAFSSERSSVGLLRSSLSERGSSSSSLDLDFFLSFLSFFCVDT